MPVALRDIDELKRLILVYVPLYPARQMIGDLYRSKASERNARLKETLTRLRDALKTAPVPANPYAITSRPDAIAAAEHALDDIVDELRRHLPDNENVRRGDVVASIRDLAQIAVSGKDLVRDQREAVRRLRDRVVAICDEVETPTRHNFSFSWQLGRLIDDMEVMFNLDNTKGGAS